MVKTEQVKYKEFGNCIRIYNEKAELYVTIDVGPRIIKYNLLDKPNVFCEHITKEPQMEETGWRIYGGHRLWHSPEDVPRSYVADNDKIEYTAIENGIQITCEIEKLTGLQKRLVVILSEETAEAAVIHSIANRGAWPVEYAVWALSVMAEGGVEVIPNNQHDTGLLHNRSMSLWPYAKMNDERVYWGDKYFTLRQTPGAETPFKVGTTNNQAWAAYFNNGDAFVKRYAHFEGENYPDNNVSFETYTNDFMLEIESLSPLMKVNPGEMLEHIEVWNITPDVKAPENTEASIQEAVDKLAIPASLIDDEHHHHHDGCGCGDDCDCGGEHHHDGGCCC